MRISSKVLSLTFLSLIVSSFATLEDVSPFLDQIPVASDGSSATSSPSPSPTTPTGAPIASNVDNAIKQWCSLTDYPDICIASIAPFLKGKPDLFLGVSIAIKSAVGATKTAILAGEKMVNSPLTPSYLKSIVKDSVDSFKDAVDNFEQAQAALPLRDWGTVNTMLSGAMTDFGDCEDQLSSEDVPVLMDFSEKLTKMTSNCLALSSLLDPQPGF